MAVRSLDELRAPRSPRVLVWGLCLLCLAGCVQPLAPASGPGYPPLPPGSGRTGSLPVQPTRYVPPAPPIVPPLEPVWGQFLGELHVELIGGLDGRLLTDFAYRDPHGKVWTAPQGSIVNGASIPKAFWSLVGGPWDGAYRQASVIHDVACVRMSEPWPEAHRAFYEACRCGGVDERTAKLMYWAVYHFGPRWQVRMQWQTQPRVIDGRIVTAQVVVAVPERTQSPAPSETLVRQAADYFQQHSPALEDIPFLKLAAE